MSGRRRYGWRSSGALLGLLGAAAGLLIFGDATNVDWRAASEAALRKPAGGPQLVSVEPLPTMEMEGEMCQWTPASASEGLFESLQQGIRTQPAAAPARASQDVDRPPVRQIRETYATYSAIALEL